MNNQTKKLTTIGMLCALAYLMAAVFRIPVVLFLRYDPKDIVIAIAGFLFGPLTAGLTAVIVSLTQMLTVSSTGFLGFVMNVLSSCAFACTASFLYTKRRRLSGAVTGLVCGVVCQTAVMLLWNYLIAPIYMGYSREMVAGLLLPAFLPFNLIKGCLNAAGAILLHKPLVSILRHTDWIDSSSDADRHRIYVPMLLAAICIIILCILSILFYNGRVFTEFL